MGRRFRMCLAVALIGVSCGPRIETSPATVTGAFGRILELNGGRQAALIGIYIPYPKQVNWRHEPFNHARQMLMGKEVRVRVVQKKHAEGYPEIDLVELFLEGRNVNHQLLETGMAFFNEDHWDAGEKEIYLDLAEKARREQLGVWSEPDKLKVLYIRPKNGRFVHFPDCKYVKGLKPEERVLYYTPLPNTPYLAVRHAYFCDDCRSRWEKVRPEIYQYTALNVKHKVKPES